MKRRQSQRLREKIGSNHTSVSHMTRMPRDERGHVRQFLDVESKMNLSHANRGFHNESHIDKDLHCFKQTNQYAACTGVFQNMKIAGECLTFCKEHVKQVMVTLINIMFSGHLVDSEGETIGHPHMFVQRPNSNFDDDDEIETPNEILFEFGEEDLDNVGPNQTIGDYVVEQFDFTSSQWQELTFDSEEADPLFFNFQGVKWPIEIDDDQVKVRNENYREKSEEESEEQEEFKCNLLACIRLIKDNVLDPRCIEFCESHLNASIHEILQLLTQNKVFVKTKRNKTFELKGKWRIDVEDSERNILAQNQKVFHGMDFSGTNWMKLSIRFKKEYMGEDNIVSLWSETANGSVYIKHFDETPLYINIHIMNPRHIMEIPD